MSVVMKIIRQLEGALRRARLWCACAHSMYCLDLQGFIHVFLAFSTQLYGSRCQKHGFQILPLEGAVRRARLCTVKFIVCILKHKFARINLYIS